MKVYEMIKQCLDTECSQCTTKKECEEYKRILLTEATNGASEEELAAILHKEL